MEYCPCAKQDVEPFVIPPLPRGVTTSPTPPRKVAGTLQPDPRVFCSILAHAYGESWRTLAPELWGLAG